MPRRTGAPFGHFNWYDIMTPDLAASSSFYAGLFGWEAVPQSDDGGGPYSMFLLAGDPVAGGGQMPPAMVDAGTPSAWNLYVCVEALEPVLERVQGGGGSIVFAPQDVGAHGRLAYCSDPEGAVFALWQPKAHIGASRAQEPGTACWRELASRDIMAAARFYGAVFGWEHRVPEHGPPSDYLLLRDGDLDVAGIIGMTEAWGGLPAHWSVYFETADIDAACEAVGRLGGEVKAGPFPAPGAGQIAVCADDVGAHFYLMQLSNEFAGTRKR